MNIDEMTIGQFKEMAKLFTQPAAIDNGMIGDYVIVRCRDAGVHFGFLESHNGRECVLSDARRLWYWKPKKGSWLSAVANTGLDSASKVGPPTSKIHLTENCEIILCAYEAVESIKNQPNHNE